MRVDMKVVVTGFHRETRDVENDICAYLPSYWPIHVIKQKTWHNIFSSARFRGSLYYMFNKAWWRENEALHYIVLTKLYQLELKKKHCGELCYSAGQL